MKILAIETSCDETGVTILEADGPADAAHFAVTGNALYSQASKHAEFGGVYPSLAKREHAANLVPLMIQALKEAKAYTSMVEQTLEPRVLEHLRDILTREQVLFHELTSCLAVAKRPNIDAIAVTKGPGLEPALWVGVNFARALAYAWNIPVIAVNHLEGHVVASAATKPNTKVEQYTLHGIKFPVLGLLISGGHTELIHASTWGSYNVVGQTRDDAVGEAFDKVARMLNLPYPGGQHISNLASEGRRFAHQKYGHPLSDSCILPRPMIHSDNLDFSFSGLKTAVLYLVRDLDTLDDHAKKRIATEFEEAVVDVLIHKVRRALSQHSAKTFVLGGGVAANEYIRKRLALFMEEEHPDIHVQFPAPGLSTDNAIMIGMAGYLQYVRLDSEAFVPKEDILRAEGRMKL